MTQAAICFFLNTGKTFTFRNVEIVSDNENAVTIKYTAMSDGLQKEATFSKFHIVGMSKWIML